MHRFTHLGHEPMVDHLLHCEQLRENAQLARQLQWPQAMREAVELLPERIRLRNPSRRSAAAEALYRRDFQWFGYSSSPLQPYSPELVEDAGSVAWIHQAPALQWHWGPRAEQEERRSVQACRQNPPVR